MSNYLVSFLVMLITGNVFAQRSNDYIHWGRSAYYNQRYSEALDDFNKAIQSEPMNAATYYERAKCKIELADDSGAIADFTKSIEIYKSKIHHDTIFQIVGTNGEIMDTEDPKEIRKWIAIIYVHRGQVRYNMELYPTAIQDYSKAIAMDALCMEAYYNRSIAYYFYGAYDKAIEDCSKTLELDPYQIKAYLISGAAKDQLKQYDAALKDFRKIETDPPSPEAYLAWGIDKFFLKDYYGAMLDYNKGLELQADNAELHNNRALCRYILNDKEGACQDWSDALELDYKPASESIKEYCK